MSGEMTMEGCCDGSPCQRADAGCVAKIVGSIATSLFSVGRAGRVMQVTTHQAGLKTPGARLALAQRIALATRHAVTPFITPDPPWLANLPLVIAIMAFLLAFGLSHIRAERVRQVLIQKRQ